MSTGAAGCCYTSATFLCWHLGSASMPSGITLRPFNFMAFEGESGLHGWCHAWEWRLRDVPCFARLLVLMSGRMLSRSSGPEVSSALSDSDQGLDVYLCMTVTIASICIGPLIIPIFCPCKGMRPRNFSYRFRSTASLGCHCAEILLRLG